MISRNKAGKRILSVPADAQVLPPIKVRDHEEDWLVAVTEEGYMLVTALNEFPLMSKGKGLKIVNLPAAKLKSGEERLRQLALVQDGEAITLFCGKKHKGMKGDEVDEYAAERGRRGLKLPRGYRQVDKLVVHFQEDE